MRRAMTSRRMCRGVVFSRSAASSNVISLSILAILLLLCGGGYGAKFLAGNLSLFAGACALVGGHQDKRVPRHGGIPSSSPRANRQPRGVRLRRLPATGGRHVRG